MQSKNEIDEIAAVHEQSQARLDKVHAEHPSPERYDDSKLLNALEHVVSTDTDANKIGRVHDKSEARREHLEKKHHIDYQNDDTKLLNALVHEVSIDGPDSDIQKIAAVHDISLIGQQHDISNTRKERKEEIAHRGDTHFDDKLVNALEHEVAVDGPHSDIERIAAVHDVSNVTRAHEAATHHSADESQ
eukprot:gene39574-48894_t